MEALELILKVLVGGFPLWFPVWLAWWLSDGFKNVSIGGDDEGGFAQAEFNPITEEPGWSITHPGGNKTYL